jgi:hypothetical protein
MVRVDGEWKRIAPCPVNTVGVEEITFGLRVSACRPCASGFITDPLVNGTAGWSTATACYNRAGWGVISNGLAAPCESGKYNAARSMNACKSCGRNRFTNPGAQARKEDCLVEPGYGLLDANQDLVGPVAAAQMTSAQAADSSVLECPPTYYSTGGAVNSVCVLCPGGHSAEGPGATSVTQCDRKSR